MERHMTNYSTFRIYDATLFKTMQHGDNTPTCIRQYHLARYRIMQFGAYLRVHVDAFLPFTSVAFEGENLW